MMMNREELCNFEPNMDTANTNIPYHIPVMLRETVDGMDIAPGGVYADMTFGGGGHRPQYCARRRHLGQSYKDAPQHPSYAKSHANDRHRQRSNQHRFPHRQAPSIRNSAQVKPEYDMSP